MARQDEETERFTSEPFQPEVAETTLRPVASRRSIRSLQRGRRSKGTNRATRATARTASEPDAGPKLSGAIAQKPAAELSQLLRHPNADMIKGEMQPVEVSDEELKALVAYIKSLK